MISETDLTHLGRCVALARAALDAGDSPFGSVLVRTSTGAVLREDRNRITTGRDVTLHPELSLVVWAQRRLTDPADRADTTVYTSGEHCPMCAAAHANAGMGRIVYVASSARLGEWREEMGATPGPVALLPVSVVAPGVRCVEGLTDGIGDADADADGKGTASASTPGTPTETGGSISSGSAALIREVKELHRLKHERQQQQQQQTQAGLKPVET
ncbi:hypothetical protein PV08_11274 [Exophiala spinifera]|uniref:CMP/dCMP-type deaminase domain-containing protein n=1 Tax=Exophiala spinifera TaxID=91928 RepID=A0A0D1ZB99_9EURO|nr:uncharacterized protein PV08_11274 [Exophiala spinifera]KIW10312.1 hypothetical protein PV08_11274 [Exophiala spinifera]